MDVPLFRKAGCLRHKILGYGPLSLPRLYPTPEKCGRIRGKHSLARKYRPPHTTARAIAKNNDDECRVPEIERWGLGRKSCDSCIACNLLCRGGNKSPQHSRFAGRIGTLRGYFLGERNASSYPLPHSSRELGKIVRGKRRGPLHPSNLVAQASRFPKRRTSMSAPLSGDLAQIGKSVVIKGNVGQRRSICRWRLRAVIASEQQLDGWSNGTVKATVEAKARGTGQTRGQRAG